MPLGDNTHGAVKQCNEIAKRDQSRSHFDWLYERYMDGVITRSALVKEATALGIELAPESNTSTSDGFTVSIQ